MGELVQRGSYTPVLGGGRPNRPLQKEMQRVQGQGELTRLLHVEEGKCAANQVDVVAAVVAHSSERLVEVIQHQRDLASGDAGVELELTALRAVGTRKIGGIIGGLFGPLG